MTLVVLLHQLGIVLIMPYLESLNLRIYLIL